jgi:hypothetical protein
MKTLVTLIALGFLFSASGNAYYFGLKSADDTVTNIQNIESELGIHLPLVAFIFDPREHYNVPAQLDEIAEQL